ncbi:DUF6941 family protein [Nocardia takedensis]
MAELDYAFVADYATVESGKLTAVGASYTQVSVASFPATHSLALGGRVRAAGGTQQVDLQVAVRPPADGPAVVINGTLTPNGDTAVYEDKIGIVFAVVTILHITGPGLVEVFIDIDGERQRRLAFNVRQV